MAVSAAIDGIGAKSVSSRVLTAGSIDSYNSFDAPDTVTPKPFAGARIDGGKVLVDLPPRSVVMLDLE